MDCTRAGSTPRRRNVSAIDDVIAMTTSNSDRLTDSTGRDRWSLMSIPLSAITARACCVAGISSPASTPALSTAAPAPNMLRAIPSAIGLLQVLPVQTISTRFVFCMPSLPHVLSRRLTTIRQNCLIRRDAADLRPRTGAQIAAAISFFFKGGVTCPTRSGGHANVQNVVRGIRYMGWCGNKPRGRLSKTPPSVNGNPRPSGLGPRLATLRSAHGSWLIADS